MQVNKTNILDLITSAPQFSVPIYQRNYTWPKSKVEKLLHDLTSAGRRSSDRLHYLGAINYVESGMGSITNRQPFHIVDGQQRLTTVSLILAAIADLLEDGESLETLSRKQIRGYYLVNELEQEDRYYRLLLSEGDRDTLIAIIDNADMPENHSTLIADNYKLIRDYFEADRSRMEAVLRGFRKIQIIDTALDAKTDDPQQIFENLNFGAEPLSTTDRVRNRLLMGIPAAVADRVYLKYWRPIEQLFGKDAFSKTFDHFLRHYLASRLGEAMPKQESYDGFLTYGEDRFGSEAGIEEILSDLYRAARQYARFRLGGEDRPGLATHVAEIRDMQIEVTFPFLFHLYEDIDAGIVSVEDAAEITRIMLSYFWRRTICSFRPGTAVNFAAIRKRIIEDRYVESFIAILDAEKGTKRFPSDIEFQEKLLLFNTYNSTNCKYLLSKLENDGRKEEIKTSSYTIEHIMPQNLTAAWVADIGDNAEDIHERLCNTIGNLTLTGYNPKLSDHPFETKLKIEGGFISSPLQLNRTVRQCDTWGEQEILARGRYLAKTCARIWERPRPPEDLVPLFAVESDRRKVYTIEDHPNLTSEENGKCFDALIAAISEAEPDIEFEFRQRYLTLKYGEVAVALIYGLKRKVRIGLHVRVDQISDPMGYFKDCSEVGTLGNVNSHADIDEAADMKAVAKVIALAAHARRGDDGGVNDPSMAEFIQAIRGTDIAA